MTLYRLKQAWCAKELADLSVTCDLAADQEAITALFDVAEPSVKAEYTGFNQRSWEESCVELFLSFGSGSYYNFEITCIGSILGEYGSGRFSREKIEPRLLEKIEVSSTLGNVPFGIIREKTKYQVRVRIPKELFVHDGCRISPEKLAGNIYKCADGSPTPHYMYLFEVKSEKADFHRPEYFGKLGV